MVVVQACVITGFGINCDYETRNAFDKAGAKTKRVHLNDLIDEPAKLGQYHVLAFPGGFSYGDDVGSGKVLANKFSQNLFDEFLEFVEAGKLVLGICNGFQVLVKMGALPALEKDYRKQEATLTFNDSGRFEDRWVSLIAPQTKCVFTQGVTELELPVRHGEGKFIASDAMLDEMFENKTVALQYVKNGEATGEYPENPNGAMRAIAGVCDSTGRVFGLMPHPECFTHDYLHPRWTREAPKGNGLKIFENAVEYVEQNF